MTNDLLALADWLRAEGCGPVVMESMGSYWRTVFNLLDEHCEVLVVNADHAKAVPGISGRKTDVKDAEWLADVLRQMCHTRTAARQLHPLTRPAPPTRPDPLPPPMRIHRVDERARLTNRRQTVLEEARLPISSALPS